MSATAVRATSATEVAGAVSAAAEQGAPLRIVAARTWLDAGRPVTGRAVELDVSALRTVSAYTPGDLTCTVGAGMTLGELDHVTGEHGQWCPLLAWGQDAGTVGATLATATAGPCAAALGLPRDLTLGLEVIDGRGSVLRAGGVVVKNVAGFDLVRLNVGAWGSLGVITAASLRLRARPQVDESFALPLEETPAAIARLEALRTGPLAPIALELVNATLSRGLGLAQQPHALVRAAGNAVFVRAVEGALRSAGDAHAVDAAIWTRLRGIEPDRCATWRESAAPALWPSLARSIFRSGDHEGRAVMAHLSVARGVLRVITELRGDDSEEAALTAGAAWRTSLRVLRERPAFDAAGESDATGTFRIPTTDALVRRVRQAFDPSSILNPGILG